MFVIGNIMSFTSQIFRHVGPLGESLNFCTSLEFDIPKNSDHETPKIKLYSVRGLKRYPKEKNLIHGQVTATVSKFSTQILETNFF